MSDYPSPPSEFYRQNLMKTSVFTVNLTMLSAAQTTQRLTEGLVNYKLETMWEEVVVAKFEGEQTRHLLERTKENLETPIVWPFCGLKRETEFESGFLKPPPC